MTGWSRSTAQISRRAAAGNRQRIAYGTDQQPRGQIALLLVRTVHLGLRRHIQTRLMYVADHPHHRDPGAVLLILEAFADGFLAHPETACHGLIDQGDLRRRGGVTLVQVAPAAQRHSERLEVTRRHQAETGLAPNSGRATGFGSNAADVPFEDQWNAGGIAGRNDSRQSLDALDDLLIKSVALGSIPIFLPS